MKKKIFFIILLLGIGFVLGRKLSKININIKSVLKEQDIYYFIQEGVYTSEKIMNENIKNIKSKKIIKKYNKYYVYLGITKNEEIAKKIKDIYEEEGYSIYIEEKLIKNDEFFNNVTQFDILLNSAKTKNEILKIEEVVLANYEEMEQNK